jgi:GTP-binding protein
LHLAILIETMRREGYEFAVSRPEVIFKQSAAGLLEPIEHIFIDVHSDYLGAVSELIGKRRGRVVNIRYGDDNSIYAEYLVPTRGTIGLRQPFLTATRGTGIMNTLFHGYEVYAGDMDTQEHGSLISLETGPVSAYALQHLQARGEFFVRPGDEVYAGQVVGENTRNEEIVINVCRTKNLTGHRAVPKAIVDSLSPPRNFSLDDAIEYLDQDELLEVTPEFFRIRKKELNHELRQKLARRARKEGVLGLA